MPAPLAWMLGTLCVVLAGATPLLIAGWATWSGWCLVRRLRG